MVILLLLLLLLLLFVLFCFLNILKSSPNNKFLLPLTFLSQTSGSHAFWLVTLKQINKYLWLLPIKWLYYRAEVGSSVMAEWSFIFRLFHLKGWRGKSSSISQEREPKKCAQLGVTEINVVVFLTAYVVAPSDVSWVSLGRSTPLRLNHCMHIRSQGVCQINSIAWTTSGFLKLRCFNRTRFCNRGSPLKANVRLFEGVWCLWCLLTTRRTLVQI